MCMCMCYVYVYVYAHVYVYVYVICITKSGPGGREGVLREAAPHAPRAGREHGSEPVASFAVQV